MSILQSYPLGNPTAKDYVIGTKIPPADTDAKPTTNNFSVSSIIALASASENHKVYVAELNNLGAGAVAPVAKVIKNTIGDIVWTRTGVGSYVGTLTGAFTEDKTFLSGQGYTVTTLVGGTGNWPNAQSLNSNNADTVSLSNFALNLTAGDNLADNVGMFIEIRVYS